MISNLLNLFANADFITFIDIGFFKTLPDVTATPFNAVLYKKSPAKKTGNL